MKKIVLAAVAVLFAANANALTIPSGHVIAPDGSVVHAAETETGKRQLAKHGYLISGGQLHLGIEDNTVSIPLNELAGKSKQRIREVVVTHVIATIADITVPAVEEALAAADGDIEAAVEQAVTEAVTEKVLSEASELTEEVIEEAAAAADEAVKKWVKAIGAYTKSFSDDYSKEDLVKIVNNKTEGYKFIEGGHTVEIYKDGKHLGRVDNDQVN